MRQMFVAPAFASALALSLIACGRVRFQPGDAGMDAHIEAVDVGVDVAMSDVAARDATNDAAVDDVPVFDVFVVADAPGDAGIDAFSDVGTDAPRDVGTDSPRDAGSDAPMSDAGMCAAILADEAAFTDEEVLACASHGGIGSCTIFDNSGFGPCPTCACEWYQQSTRVACGACPSRWTPTGCTDFGAAPTWAPECASSAPGRALAICSLRALLRTGECAPCTCP